MPTKDRPCSQVAALKVTKMENATCGTLQNNAESAGFRT